MDLSLPVLTAFSEFRQSLGLDEALDQRLQAFYECLIEANQTMNLTRITEADDFWIKHLWDTLTLMPYLPKMPPRLLDLGTGGGIPGIPLWLANPDWELTLLDSVGKKLKSLDTICQTLRQRFPETLIKRPRTVHIRAEDAGQSSEHRELYVMVVSRAVARLPILLEYALPLVKRNGVFIAMKGPQYESETEGLSEIAGILGARLAEVVQPELPDGQIRTLLIFEKRSLTPKSLPRAAGVPKRQPLSEFTKVSNQPPPAIKSATAKKAASVAKAAAVDKNKSAQLKRNALEGRSAGTDKNKTALEKGLNFEVRTAKTDGKPFANPSEMQPTEARAAGTDSKPFAKPSKMAPKGRYTGSGTNKFDKPLKRRPPQS